MASAEPGRRPVTLALPPLVVIAAVFFLPFVDNCGPKPERPLAMLLSGGLRSWWIVPPFFSALLLALAIALALRFARAPGWPLAVVALLACGASDGLWIAMHEATKPDTTWERRYAQLAAAGVVLALVCVGRGLRRARWVRFGHFVGAYVFLAAPHVWPVVSVEHLHQIGIGGYLYVAALAALLPLAGWAMLAREATD